jgi:hypothetical protein
MLKICLIDINRGERATRLCKALANTLVVSFPCFWAVRAVRNEMKINTGEGRMTVMRALLALLAVTMLVVPCSSMAAEATTAEVEQLKRDIEDLRKQLRTVSAPTRASNVERALDSKYGPNATVSTKNGKLTIGGLVQAWYYTFQHESRAMFDGAGAGGGAGVVDSNETQDVGGFRVRRTELKFTMDIHENVTAVVMIDPATEATNFPLVTDNQADSGTIFKRREHTSPEFEANAGAGAETGRIGAVQSGAGTVNRLLQDAYINYHGVIPHHDFQVGQFKPWMGEEGIRSSAQLDFVERSFVGLLADTRDLGTSVHGTWWDDRFQYWLGVFNGAGNYLGSAGVLRNRADDNDEKDFNYRVLVRPLWDTGNECSACGGNWWGKMELGASGRIGRHGAEGADNPIATPLDGLNRHRSIGMWHDFWFYYAPGGPVRGLWVRAEGAWIKDRNAPLSVVSLEGAGPDVSNLQSDGHTTHVWGGYAAIGYKLSESRWADCGCNDWLKNFEFVARGDTFQNVQVTDPAVEQHTNNYRTVVYTGGVNYYIKGHDAKIQLNYNSVHNPTGNKQHFHNVDNDSFVVNFQVAF